MYGPATERPADPGPVSSDPKSLGFEILDKSKINKSGSAEIFESVEIYAMPFFTTMPVIKFATEIGRGTLTDGDAGLEKFKIGGQASLPYPENVSGTSQLKLADELANVATLASFPYADLVEEALDAV
jgi:hypothetical protein